MKDILIAPNAFKHSLSATEAADALRKGFLKSQLDCRLRTFPIADGGDGTAQLIRQHFEGRHITKTVSAPLGNRIRSSFEIINDGNTAVVEMAAASGLHLLDNKERDPMETSSRGTGELIKAALDHKVKKIIIAMGGSATVDGGCGILAALGVRFLNAEDAPLSPIPKSLASLDKIDITNLDDRLKDCEIIVMCDVNNKLLGEKGAAAIFGPQKGATAREVKKLEHFLRQFQIKTQETAGKDISNLSSGGTAGGAAAGLYAFLDGKLVKGISHFLKLTDFEKRLQNTDYLITGEGQIDEQTPEGKAPAGVAHIAKKHGVPCIAVAGQVPLQPSHRLTEMFDSIVPITHKISSLDKALAHTENNLIRTGEMIGTLLNL